MDGLDAEAWKRATEGASDRLLMFLLKAHRPDVYNPVRRTEISGPGEDGAIVVQNVELTSAERRAAIAGMLGLSTDVDGPDAQGKDQS